MFTNFARNFLSCKSTYNVSMSTHVSRMHMNRLVGSYSEFLQLFSKGKN